MRYHIWTVGCQMNEADSEKLAEVGRACGQQVRIQRSSSQYAVFTVSEVHQESPDTVVRMGAQLIE